MLRQPIKTHQREVLRFVLQWLVLRALRYVQLDSSFQGCTKAPSHLDSLIRRDRDLEKVSAQEVSAQGYHHLHPYGKSDSIPPDNERPRPNRDANP
jgi:hypothetical protein